MSSSTGQRLPNPPTTNYQLPSSIINVISIPPPLVIPNIGQSGVWSPKYITGCSLWLDAADSSQLSLSAGTSNITTWKDKSSNGWNATAAGNPVYNSTLKRVQFNGSTSYLSNLSYAINLSQRSFFLVLSENSRTNVAGVFSQIPNPRTGNDYQTTNGMTIETSSGLYFYANNGGYSSALGNTILLTQAIYNDNMNGTQGSSYLSGANTSNRSANYTAGTCAGYMLGARWAGAQSTPYLNGNINEVIVYNVPLTMYQRQQVEGYLAWKWGLVSQLPASHPYKLFPPSP